nr:hybrid sensor histidine kinase/response regulator transcription factor [Pedobacter panaciterrae]
MDQSNRIWVGTNGAGVFLYNEQLDSFSQFLGDRGNETLAGKNIYTMQWYEDELVLGIHEGTLMVLNTQKNSAKSIHSPAIDHSIIRNIQVFDKTLWVGTQNGLYNTTLDLVKNATKNTVTIHLNDKFIERIFKDREGGIWVATKFGGVNYLPVSGANFEVYRPKDSGINNVSNRIKSLIKDADGKIWIGTEDSGLLTFEPQTETFNRVKTPSQNNLLTTLLYDNGNVWAGFFKCGLDILDTKNNTATHYKMSTFGIQEESVFVLYLDQQGNVWLGNGLEIYRKQKGKSNFERMDIFNTCYVYEIFQDSQGYIWFATMGSGIFMYDPINDKLRQFLTSTGEGLTTNLINSVSEDHKGQLWFSTDREGIVCYNKEKNTFKNYSVKEGLPDNVAYKILEDDKHNLWFGTNRGLVCFNPETNHIVVYTTKDGLPSNNFNSNSALIGSKGVFYMGTLGGLIAFNPNNFVKNMFVPPTYITQLSAGGQIAGIQKEDFPSLTKNISFLDRIELRHNQASISLEFSSLSFASPNSNRFAYMLEGVDRQWIFTQKNNTASYANLRPGTYRFKVKGSNNDGVWGKARILTIKILPPWWASSLAYIIYTLFFLGLIYGSYSIIKKRQALKLKRRQLIFEAKKEKELYEAKINFFTEVAHEIRTPLTLINAPLESILEGNLGEERIKQNLDIMQRNGRLLMGLINQLLDFRKIDAERFILNITKIEIIDLLGNSLSNFYGAIRDKGFDVISKYSEDQKIYLKTDKEALEKVINNLFSNAIKYGHKELHIRFKVENNLFKLSVLNDGPLIPRALQNKIFEPFVRGGDIPHHVPGSGLGLSLVKSLVELMQGTIFYSVEENLNCFELNLPIVHSEEYTNIKSISDNPFDPMETEEQPIEIVNNLQFNSQDKIAVLIVDDNTDILMFLNNELSEKYDIVTSSTVEDAMSILQERKINVVISDIMMTGADGFELCRRIKSENSLNHIIVVLMTALNDLESKMKALEIGADAYVEKPFSIRYLTSLIDSLLKNRKLLIGNINKDPLFGVEVNDLSKNDVVFLEKVIDLINSNLEDSKLSVEKLAEMLNYSRSSLHRRIKAITSGYSPIELIRLVRMQRAVELLKEEDYRINEIAYLVGLSSPSYFVKIFQSHFNMSPKEFRDSLRKK